MVMHHTCHIIPRDTGSGGVVIGQRACSAFYWYLPRVMGEHLTSLAGSADHGRGHRVSILQFHVQNSPRREKSPETVVSVLSAGHSLCGVNI